MLVLLVMDTQVVERDIEILVVPDTGIRSIYSGTIETIFSMNHTRRRNASTADNIFPLLVEVVPLNTNIETVILLGRRQRAEISCMSTRSKMLMTSMLLVFVCVACIHVAVGKTHDFDWYCTVTLKH